MQSSSRPNATTWALSLRKRERQHCRLMDERSRVRRLGQFAFPRRCRYESLHIAHCSQDIWASFGFAVLLLLLCASPMLLTNHSTNTELLEMATRSRLRGWQGHHHRQSDVRNFFHPPNSVCDPIPATSTALYPPRKSLYGRHARACSEGGHLLCSTVEMGSMADRSSRFVQLFSWLSETISVFQP